MPLSTSRSPPQIVAAVLKTHQRLNVVDRLFTAAERLERFPASGRSLPELPGAPLREIIDGNYRIVYRVREDAVEILTVFDGHRRIPEDDLPRVKKKR